MKKILILTALTLGGFASAATSDFFNTQKTIVRVFAATQLEQNCIDVGQKIHTTRPAALSAGLKANAASIVKPIREETKDFTFFAGALRLDSGIIGYVSIVNKYPSKSRYAITTCVFPLKP